MKKVPDTLHELLDEVRAEMSSGPVFRDLFRDLRERQLSIHPEMRQLSLLIHADLWAQGFDEDT